MEPVEPAPARGITIGWAALLMLAAAATLALRGGASRADQPVAAQEVSEPFHPMVVVNPGVPFVTFTDLSVPVFNHSHVSSQLEVPYPVWSNLPR